MRNPDSRTDLYDGNRDARPQAEASRDRRNPPEATRFKPGQSGNPAGRPKGATGRRKAVRDVLLEKRAVRTSNSQEPEQRTTLELVFMILREKALKGDRRAIKTLQDFDAQYNRNAEPGTPGVGFLVVPECCETIEEWEALYSPREEPSAQSDEFD